MFRRIFVRFSVIAFLLAMATEAMAADLTVNSVLAIEYDNGTFAAAVLAHGPKPVLLARLLVNGAEVMDAKTEHYVLYPKLNLTLFKFSKQGEVVQVGDRVTAEVMDINNQAEKTVTCAPGQFFHHLVVCR